MDDLQDLREILGPPETLTLKISGVSYEVEPVTAKEGLQLEVFLADFDAGNAKVSNGEFWKMALGDVLTELEANVIPVEITRCAWTALYWRIGNQDFARKVWAGVPKPEGDEGKAPAPASKPRTRSRRTDGATTTHQRGSGSGTKTSRKA